MSAYSYSVAAQMAAVSHRTARGPASAAYSNVDAMPRMNRLFSSMNARPPKLAPNHHPPHALFKYQSVRKNKR